MNKKLLVPMRWMVLLCFIFGSCKESTVENQKDEIAIGLQAGETQLSLVNDISLELPEAGPALGIIGSMTVLEDYIIVLDGLRKSVEVFDIAGNYKWSIGSRGNAKGEYKMPSRLAIINNDQMLLYDGGTGRLLRFSIKGEFLGQLKLPERRFINRMMVSEDQNFIHTYVDKDKNGMLCVTSLETGEDLAKFKVCDAQYMDLFLLLGRTQGIAYNKKKKIIYFALPWEEKIMRIDLATQDFLLPITLSLPKFIRVKMDDSKTQKELAADIHNFSRLNGMHLLSSGDMLLRYLFNDTSKSTGLILLSNLSLQPSAQEVENELGLYDVFSCYGMFVYRYLSPTDDEETNGRIRIYRLSNSPEFPAE